MSTINGSIYDVSNQLRGGAKLEFYLQGGAFASSTKTITSPPKTKITEDDGTFEIELLGERTYIVRFYYPDDETYEEKTIVVPASGTYNINTLFTSSSASGGNYSHCVSFDRGDVPLNGEYLGGRHRWANVAFLKSGSIVALNGPVGASQIWTLEVNGTLTAYTITISAGQTSGEVALDNLLVTAGQYVRWKCTSAPASAGDCAGGVYLSMNVNT